MVGLTQSDIDAIAATTWGEFLLDDERRQAAFAKVPAAALAIDVFEEIFEEAQRDGFTFDSRTR